MFPYRYMCLYVNYICRPSTGPVVSYEGRLLYYTDLKVVFDGNVDTAWETYTTTNNQVNLDYLNAYMEHSSYLLVETNHHIGTIATWRPTAMPDIITIPPGFGGAAYTRSLERMVHYKLGQPQFFDSEQNLFSSWRLVRQVPEGSNTALDPYRCLPIPN